MIWKKGFYPGNENMGLYFMVFESPMKIVKVSADMSDTYLIGVLRN